MRSLAFLIVLTTLGGIAPPRASSHYRMVSSYFEESRITAFDMNSSGSVVRVDDFAVGYDPENITFSPDGRVFVVTGTNAPAGPTYFFVDREGTFTISNLMEVFYSRGAAFDPTSTFCYIFDLPIVSRQIDTLRKTVSDTNYSYYPDFGSMGWFVYSNVFGGIVIPDWDYVVGIPLSSGDFGSPTEPFYFTGGSNSDMDVSPDGRYVAIAGIDVPQLTILSVSPSGEFQLVQSLFPTVSPVRNSYRVKYTPDGRHLLTLFDRRDFLVSLAVNPMDGTLTEVDHATRTEDDLGGYIIDALAITPDSKYVVTLSGNYNGLEQTFLVFRLEEDGQLTRITQERHDWPGYVSDMDFIPPYREPVTAAGTGWMFYE